MSRSKGKGMQIIYFNLSWSIPPFRGLNRGYRGLMTTDKKNRTYDENRQNYKKIRKSSKKPDFSGKLLRWCGQEDLNLHGNPTSV